MSSKIDIIATGYARMTTTVPSWYAPSPSSSAPAKAKFMEATGSCCLVRSQQTVCLFDTMGPWERDQLLEGLARLKLHPDDIQYLVCSHSHPDHIGNLNLFTKNSIRHFVGTSVYTKDVYDLNLFEPTGSYKYQLKPRGSPAETTGDAEVDVITYEPFRITHTVRLEPTPGHTLECISMLIDDCESLGRVALVGDLFENGKDLEDESIWLGAGSQSPDMQRAQRARIYDQVDHILPGHGPLFAAPGQLK